MLTSKEQLQIMALAHKLDYWLGFNCPTKIVIYNKNYLLKPKGNYKRIVFNSFFDCVFYLKSKVKEKERKDKQIRRNSSL